MDKNPVKIKAMFGSIASSYDTTNAAMTGGMYHKWNTKLVDISDAVPGNSILDVATGTGNLAFLFAEKLNRDGSVVGLDFTKEMLDIANERKAKSNFVIADFILGDALDLPFEDNSFDICSIAYGIRNVASVENCINEMCRVLKPGGRILILEAGRPKGIFAVLMKCYIGVIIPLIGKIFSKNKNAYEYLRNSSNKFPSGNEFIEILKETGSFRSLENHVMGFGAIHIYKGIKI